MVFKEQHLEKTINRDLIPPPLVFFTERALNQLKIIIENDFTLAGKYFRIVISGKGCEGFTYAAGFTDLHEEDFQVKIANTNDDIFIVIDPFAAFYLREASVDFIQDFNKDAEGFIITNHMQKKFQGKFWNKNPQDVPQFLSEREGEM